MYEQDITRLKNPDYDPFIIQKSRYLILFLTFTILPILVSLILSFLLLKIVEDSGLNFSLPLLAFSIIVFVFSFITAIFSYNNLKKYNLKGTISTDLTILLETSLLRLRSLIGPIFLLLIVGAIFFPRDDSGSTDYSFLSNFIPYIGLIIPFIGLYSVFTIFFDFIDDYNNKIFGFSNKFPSTEISTSLKQYGKQLGFDDVKFRYGDVDNDDFCNVVWSVKRKNIVYMVLSSILITKLTHEEHLAFAVRDLFRLKYSSYNRYYFFTFIRNFCYFFAFVLIGLVVISFFAVDFTKPLILSNSTINYSIIMALLFFISATFFKTYLNIFDLKNQLHADKKTIDHIDGLSGEKLSKNIVASTIVSTLKLNPMIVETRGFNFRRSILKEYSNTSNEKPTQKKISWEDL